MYAQRNLVSEYKQLLTANNNIQFAAGWYVVWLGQRFTTV